MRRVIPGCVSINVPAGGHKLSKTALPLVWKRAQFGYLHIWPPDSVLHRGYEAEAVGEDVDASCCDGV